MVEVVAMLLPISGFDIIMPQLYFKSGEAILPFAINNHHSMSDMSELSIHTSSHCCMFHYSHP